MLAPPCLENPGDRSGEAWERGPIVLSWEDVQASGHDGFNVVLHELSHALDMRRDGANGAPPLHADMDPAAWKHDIIQLLQLLNGQIGTDLVNWRNVKLHTYV